MHQGNLLISGWKTLISTQSWRGRRAAGAGRRGGSGKGWRKGGKFFNVNFTDIDSIYTGFIMMHGSLTCFYYGMYRRNQSFSHLAYFVAQLVS